MARYFIEVSYKGTRYAGFQVQDNVLTIQSEVEKALQVYFRRQVNLTGSSRTDSGVHAWQNYFHFDADFAVPDRAIYNLNSILPGDIAIRSIRQMPDEAHARFDAIAREYEYTVYKEKNPFIADRGYYFPYTVEEELLKQAAGIIKEYTDFTSFSKRNTQVRTFNCNIIYSEWVRREDTLVYRVKANRFLRGMVRGLTGTMLKVARGKMSLDDLRSVIEAKDCTGADFSVPGHGLLLVKVEYPAGYFEKAIR
ncbi:tRNA pseudouridine(38-40) synthase TruA [Pseudoflavitalea sp. G-6-1-2]|uniref:tRNA pseudouridine(38-40) synthase TruA n=1 Tax=Pseudoflavitalea sp. G-6-1-2 TaxID=2728841 RepID=UPI00146C9155|nr:tRNA pseudouridine(38-40) synthase TruA [Pseudoflavitalea sp. G-6-1-2]NML24011.1 tRNA pseudouridine(38-40) synthase TruA [Pseudoflavitalea sp. G-6-1-2]